MMSVEVIIAVNNEIARKAAREGLLPYVPFSAEEVTSPFSFPNIGSLKPRGWRKTGETWFVDKTGHGFDNEPALTWQQFGRRLAGYILRHPSHGFAIIEEGEFQVVVSAFRRI
jgi:hypothetical protein